MFCKRGLWIKCQTTAKTKPWVMAATPRELLGGKYSKTPGVKAANKIAITMITTKFIFINTTEKIL